MFKLFQKTEPEAQAPAATVEARPSRGTLRRIASSVTRMFKAGESDRLTMNWGTVPISADVAVQRWQRTLVVRSREQAANNDHARAYVRMCRQNIVGPNGVVLQAQAKTSKGKLDKELNEAIELSFARWGHRDNCDVTGLESWRSMQSSVVASCPTDGEFIIRKVYGREAGAWGFALQIIDPIRCPADYDVQRPNRNDTNFIRAGIEYTKFGKPVAFHITTTTAEEAEYSSGGRHYVRIPAGEIIHGYRKDMVGQKRGFPWMATGLFRLRNLNGYEDAAIINARIGASKVWAMQFEPGFGPQYDEDDPPEMNVEPGTGFIVPEGGKLVDWSPQSPSGELGPMVKHMLRSIGAGWGVPYNELSGDLEGVNFSSIRQGTLDSRENWKELQEWLVETLCQPVFEAWLEYSLLAGKITNAKGKPVAVKAIDTHNDIAWQPRRWDWIDPRADVDAAVESKNNFLKSPGQIIRESGRDPQTVWMESARDQRAIVEAYVEEGFTKEEALELVKLSMGMQPKPPAPAEKPTPKAANE
ncbi:phage portal protein [Aquabacterium sp.]|uniref:phage portal protein n=1 Tax=Aquabacterium sp. TaxID=1872578 RepID=UPI0025C692A8|nr:phage portal protein [Aquabacterium sp.]